MTCAPLLLHAFSTFRVGGPQVRFVALADYFGPKYRHAILAMDGAYDCQGRLAPAIDVRRVDIAVRKRNTIGNVVGFRRILRSCNPDLLITYNWGAIEWALANRPQIVPHLHIEDGFGPEEADRQLRRRVVARRLALARSTVVTPSRNLQRLASSAWRVPVQAVRYIPNGIDCDRFASVLSPFPVPSGSGPVIGTVAALRPEKNIGLLLRAFRRVLDKTPCRLVIAGDGPSRSELEHYAKQLLPAQSVLFTGQVNQVEQIYASLDIFVLSSDTEQMPTSLMEAMASGLPVVCTSVGDVLEMVTPANLPFIVPRDDQLFMDALWALVSDPQLRSSLGAANRTRAHKQFGVSRMFRDYDSLFRSLVKSHFSA